MEKADAKKKGKVIMDVDQGDTKGKQAALANTIAGIEKQFGKGAIMKLGDNMNKNIPVITTGILSLDLALGVGGVPKGRVIEIYGPEASGKTTLALHVVAETQKAGGIAGYIDAEHALDPVYARKLGVDINELYISQPDDGEQALEICEAMVRSSAIDIIVIDSVAALVPKAEIEGDMGSSHVGVQARLMSQALRKLTGIISKTNCIVIFINQLREKIGISYGNPETTTGGRALKFYSSIRIDVRRGEAIKNGTEVLGNKTTAKIVKNKVAPPFKSCVFDIVYGEGVSKVGDILDAAVDLNIVNKSGAWFSYKETRLGQGRENTKAFLSENSDILSEINTAVRKHYNLDPQDESEDDQLEAEKGESDQTSSKSKKSKKGKPKEEERLLIDPALLTADKEGGVDSQDGITDYDGELELDDGFDGE